MADNKKDLHCDMIYKGDKPFKRSARTKQSLFREKMLKVGYDPTNKYGQYGAFLLPGDVDEGKNFYEGFRTEILDRIKHRYHTMSTERHDGLYADMLRSEHIPWDIFVPMDLDRDAAAKVFNAIIGDTVVDEITRIEIEWAPDKTKCLNDKTSFDTYVEYLSKGRKCGIGIEVKYTEEGYPIGIKEKREVEDEDSRYAIITKTSGIFTKIITNMPLRETELPHDEYRQIWRNHILGGSMVMNKMLDCFHSITLFPSGNPHFADVLPKYRQFLSEYGNASFGYITFEELFDLLEVNYKGDKFQKWVEYLKERYPF